MAILKSILLFFWLLLPMLTFAQTEWKAKPDTALIERNVDYLLLRYTESFKWTSVRITHPDGKFEEASKRYKWADRHKPGDYRWLMNVLNEFIAEGYAIKSHTMTTPYDENSDTFYHIYILERDFGD